MWIAPLPIGFRAQSVMEHQAKAQVGSRVHGKQRGRPRQEGCRSGGWRRHAEGLSGATVDRPSPSVGEVQAVAAVHREWEPLVIGGRGGTYEDGGCGHGRLGPGLARLCGQPLPRAKPWPTMTTQCAMPLLQRCVHWCHCPRFQGNVSWVLGIVCSLEGGAHCRASLTTPRL